MLNQFYKLLGLVGLADNCPADMLVIQTNLKNIYCPTYYPRTLYMFSRTIFCFSRTLLFYFGQIGVSGGLLHKLPTQCAEWNHRRNLRRSAVDRLRNNQSAPPVDVPARPTKRQPGRQAKNKNQHTVMQKKSILAKIIENFHFF